MTRVINLIQEEVYFLVGFHDEEFHLPCIATCIYKGVDNEGKYGHMFLRPDGGGYLSFQDGEINGILDKNHLISWLQEEHSPQNMETEVEYEYKNL